MRRSTKRNWMKVSAMTSSISTIDCAAASE
jgi:hypothetical protein